MMSLSFILPAANTTRMNTRRKENRMEEQGAPHLAHPQVPVSRWTEGKRTERIRSLERVGIASLLFLASILFIGIPSPEASQTPVGPSRTLEFRYRAPEAGEVFLIWGIEGWQAVPEREQPQGTTIRNRVMHTPMVRRGSSFLANVQVDPDVSVEYGFLVTKTCDGLELEVRPVWDGRKEFQVRAGESPDLLEIDSSLGTVPPDRPRNVPFRPGLSPVGGRSRLLDRFAFPQAAQPFPTASFWLLL